MTAEHAAAVRTMLGPRPTRTGYRRAVALILLGVACFLLAMLLGGCGGAMLMVRGPDFGRSESRHRVESGDVTIVAESKASVRGVELLQAAPAGFWDLLGSIVSQGQSPPPGVPRTGADWTALARCDAELEAALVRLLEAYESGPEPEEVTP